MKGQKVQQIRVADAIMAAAFLCNVAAFFAPRRAAKRLLAASCLIALLVSVYESAIGHTELMRSGEHLSWPVMIILIVQTVSPTNIALILVLIFIRAINRLKLWSVFVAICVIWNWLGLGALS